MKNNETLTKKNLPNNRALNLYLWKQKKRKENRNELTTENRIKYSQNIISNIDTPAYIYIYAESRTRLNGSTN